ncbi:hypothetical protein SBV1_2960010 [Verrucomicrobia bacterium]|nr:hypothetical protein SBV1_2960010 [Verrucomicrobiota bacterium]
MARFMGSPVSLSRMHWDHEPGDGSAGASPYRAPSDLGCALSLGSLGRANVNNFSPSRNTTVTGAFQAWYGKSNNCTKAA